jgi:ribose transport system permease protein
MMGQKTFGSVIKKIFVENNTYIIFVFLFIICSALSDQFFTEMNIRNILLQRSAPLCAAIGMLFVVLTGGIDLSVGSLMAFAASLSAICVTNYGWHFMPALAAGVISGVVFGTLTGVLVAYANMQGFVASLAVMTIARGAAFMITNGTPIKLAKGTLNILVDRAYFFPIVIISIILIIVFILIQNYTSYGRLVIAIGSNSMAVELAGIRVKRYVLSVYMLSGALSALGGVFIAARASTGSATIGSGQELEAIAACVIGGASLAGGSGIVFRTVTGVMVLALIGNIMNLMAIPSYPQDVIKGIIIILAVLMQLFTGKSEKTV